MRQKVYLETTVISYHAARPSTNLLVLAHQHITREWWETRRTDFDLFVSQLVVQEAEAGDAEAANKRLALVERLPLLEMDDRSRQLVHELIKQRAIPQQAVEDAFHVAVASVHGMDYLMTWNCRHIANAQTRSLIERVCRSSGYEPPVICTPEELLGD